MRTVSVNHEFVPWLTDTVLGQVHGCAWKCLSSSHLLTIVTTALWEKVELFHCARCIHTSKAARCHLWTSVKSKHNFLFIPFPTNMHLVQSKASGAVSGVYFQQGCTAQSHSHVQCPRLNPPRWWGRLFEDDAHGRCLPVCPCNALQKEYWKIFTTPNNNSP